MSPEKLPEPLRIAYSPCPNDTFVFDAWAHGRVPGAPALDVTFADIDITNGMAERGESDVLKVSYAVLPYVLDEYALLPCGGALGRGCGPLVLTREPGPTWRAVRSPCPARRRRRTCSSVCGRRTRYRAAWARSS